MFCHGEGEQKVKEGYKRDDVDGTVVTGYKPDTWNPCGGPFGCLTKRM